VTRRKRGGVYYYYPPARKVKTDAGVKRASRAERQASVNDPRLAPEPKPEPTVAAPIPKVSAEGRVAELEGQLREREWELAVLRKLPRPDPAGLIAIGDDVAEMVTKAITDRMLEKLIPEVDTAFSLLIDRLTERLSRVESQPRQAPAAEKLAAVQSTEPVITRKIAVTVEATLPPVRKQRVAILGLLNEQEREMERRFGNTLDLRFVPSCRRSKLRRKVDGCDFVIVMVKFLSHCSTEAIKNHPGYSIVPGGMSELADRLSAISTSVMTRE
jgi:hypothetical protein